MIILGNCTDSTIKYVTYVSKFRHTRSKLSWLRGLQIITFRLILQISAVPEQTVCRSAGECIFSHKPHKCTYGDPMNECPPKCPILCSTRVKSRFWLPLWRKENTPKRLIKGDKGYISLVSLDCLEAGEC